MCGQAQRMVFSFIFILGDELCNETSVHLGVGDGHGDGHVRS